MLAALTICTSDLCAGPVPHIPNGVAHFLLQDGCGKGGYDAAAYRPWPAGLFDRQDRGARVCGQREVTKSETLGSSAKQIERARCAQSCRSRVSCVSPVAQRKRVIAPGLCSSSTQRRAAAPSGAWFLRWRSCQGVRSTRTNGAHDFKGSVICMPCASASVVRRFLCGRSMRWLVRGQCSRALVMHHDANR